MRSLRFRLVPAVLVILAALLLAACGGDETSKDDYQDQMRNVAKDITTASDEVSSMKPDAEPADRAKTIRRQSELLEAAADKAEGIDAPGDAEDAHKEFVGALRDYAKLLGRLADASGDGGSSEEQAALLGEAQDPLERLDKASTRLSNAGYTFSK